MSKKPAALSDPTTEPQRSTDGCERAEGFDPYNHVTAIAADHPGGAHKHRSVGDIRELNGPIEDTLTCTPCDKGTVTLTERVAALSVELERVLAELGDISSAASDPADRRAREVKRRLGRAANYLEEALDCLMPAETTAEIKEDA